MSNKNQKNKLDRRTFLRSGAAVSAGLILAPMVLAETAAPAKKSDDINVALLGVGSQGQTLFQACLKMGKNSGVHFKAVCDIWPYNLEKVSKYLKAYKYEHNTYTDFQEMLDKEKDLDTVIIATPDFWHSPHTVACLKAGLNVYCEKEMSNTLEGAKQMVLAARQAGKLLQIGHQRRSNPRYIFCYEKLIKEAKLIGRITTINGQWNRSRNACLDMACPPGTEIAADTLNKFGFESMKQFMNWRWYKGLGGGPIVDLGSHQIDVYSWFLGCSPKSVIASGGTDYWKERQWYDSVIALYEYHTPDGIVRASYQTITTNSSNGYFETFMGDQGTLNISEPTTRGGVYRESAVEEKVWEPWVIKGYIQKEGGMISTTTATTAVVDPRASIPAAKYNLPITMDKPYHQPHLENFFNAIRGKEKLNCPAEIGYESAVAVLKVNEAIVSGKKLDFTAEEFKV